MSSGGYAPPPTWAVDNDGSSMHANSSHGLQGQQASAPLVSHQKVMKHKKTILMALKALTIGLSVLMAFTALIAMSQLDGVTQIGKIFVGVYMLCFSFVLCSFEVIEILPFEALANVYRRNFGFLYGAKGKGLFIIFVAFLSFGVGDSSLCFMTGFLMASLGVLEVGLFLKYPDVFEEPSTATSG